MCGNESNPLRKALLKCCQPGHIPFDPLLRIPHMLQLVYHIYLSPHDPVVKDNYMGAKYIHAKECSKCPFVLLID